MALHSRSQRPLIPHPLSLTSTLLSNLIFLPGFLPTSFTTAQTATPFTPIPVYGAAYGRTASRLFVLSGGTSPVAGTAATDQFMALDLFSDWDATSPPWTQLQAGPKQIRAAGTFSKDQNTFYAFHIPSTTSSSSVWQYNVKTGRWTVVDANPLYGLIENTGAVTNPQTGEIFCPNGCSAKGQGLLHIWDPAQPSLMLSSVLPPLVAPTLPALGTGDAGVFQMRLSYGNVWSAQLNRVLYFGGYASVRPDNTVTLLDTKSRNFTTMVSNSLPALTKGDGYKICCCPSLLFTTFGTVTTARKALMLNAQFILCSHPPSHPLHFFLPIMQTP